MNLLEPLLRPDLVPIRMAARTEAGVLGGQVTIGGFSIFRKGLRPPGGIDPPEVGRHVPFKLTKRHGALGHGGHVAGFTCEVLLKQRQGVSLDGGTTISVAALALRPQSTVIRLVAKPSCPVGIMAGNTVQLVVR